MKKLSIQLQPDRVSTLDVGSAAETLEAIGKLSTVVNDYLFEEGEENGRYLNFTYTTTDLHHLWSEIVSRVYSGSMGEEMHKSTIATCEGDRGWDDYLLLHHYDSSEKTDRL